MTMSNWIRPGLRHFSQAALAVLCIGFHQIAIAQIDYQWDAATGDYNDGTNWSPNGIPSDFFDNAYIDNGGTATFSSGDVVIGSGQIGVGFAASSSGMLEVTGGRLAPNQALIGQLGTGVTSVDGGNLEVGGGSLFIGGTENSGGQTGMGTLNITGGPNSRVSSGDDFQMGAAGTGVLNMSGGYARGVYTVVGKFGTGEWNHSGGIFDHAGGDIEIGDGGRPDQSGTPGPRTGTINLTGGVISVHEHVGIGNRSGSGTVNISGGVLELTGTETSTLDVGRGMDWGAGEGGPTTLRVTGDDALILINGNLELNPSLVSSSSTLVAEITGPSHTPIKAVGSANIANGNFKVELNGYSPVSGADRRARTSV